MNTIPNFDTIQATTQLVVTVESAEPLTRLYLSTCSTGCTETGLVNYWNSLAGFFAAKRVNTLSNMLAAKYIKSLQDLHAELRYQRRDDGYEVKRGALSLELDESFDFFDFSHRQHRLNGQVFDTGIRLNAAYREFLEVCP